MSDNVTPIDSARKTKDGKQSQEKVNPVVLFEHVSQLIRFEGTGAWPARFRVYEPERGKRFPVCINDDGEASVVPLDAVTASVMEYARRRALGASVPAGEGPAGAAPRGAGDDAPPAAWLFDDDKCIKAARYWLRSAKTLAHIPMIAWKGEAAPVAWRRLPWSKDEHGPTPTWDRLLEGTTNAEAIKLWIASCFVETADLSTYLWLHGDGANGKSRILAFLARAFGPSFFGTDDQSAQNKHWTAALVGKRVVAFPDTNTRRMTTSGRFKAMTGNDPVTIEPKYMPMFAGRLPVRFVMSSNNEPEISSGEADMRRCIFVGMKVIPADERLPVGVVDKALWDEGGAFVSSCLRLYAERCPGDCVIPFDKGETEMIARESETEFSVIADYLRVDASRMLAGKELHQLMRRVMRPALAPRMAAAFREYVIRSFKIKRARHKTGVFYEGICLNYKGWCLVNGGLDSVFSRPVDEGHNEAWQKYDEECERV